MTKILLLLLWCLTLPATTLKADDIHTNETMGEMLAQGERFVANNEIDSAMNRFMRLSDCYRKEIGREEKIACAKACREGARICIANEAYLQAFHLCFKGIEICEENGLNTPLVGFYNYMGNIYSVFNDSDLAIRYYKRSLKAAQENGTMEDALKTIINLAAICAMEGQVEEAERYYQDMMNLFTHNSVVEYFEYMNLALIKSARHRYEEAIELLYQTIECAQRTGLGPIYISSGYSELAAMYEKQGNREQALHYYTLNEDFCREHNLIYAQKENLKSLADLYTALHEREKADSARYAYFLVSDSLMNSDEFKQLKSSLFAYEMDRNSERIDVLTSDREQKAVMIRLQRIVLFIVLAFVLLLTLSLTLLYRQNRKLRSAYQNLFHKNNEMLQVEADYKVLKREYDRMREQEQKLKLEQELKQIPTPETAEEPKSEETAKTYASSRISAEQKEAILQKIRQLMEETQEFCNPDFSLEKMAMMVGSNSRYVSQIINETYQKNFRLFVNEYRIKKSCRMLLDVAHYGNFTIKAIGEQVGYKSYANFTETFKKVTGLLPSNYQKMAKEDTRKGDTDS